MPNPAPPAVGSRLTCGLFHARWYDGGMIAIDWKLVFGVPLGCFMLAATIGGVLTWLVMRKSKRD